MLSPPFLPCFTDSQCDRYVATKQDFTVPLDYVPNVSERLRWMHKNNIIFDRQGTKVSKGSADDVFQNGSLRLRNVDKSKSGKYTPFVYYEGKAKGNLKAIDLCVMGRLQICFDSSYVV